MRDDPPLWLEIPPLDIDETPEDIGGHTPVLVREVSELLAVREGDTVVDVTVGLGGHARILAEQLGPSGTLIALDMDPSNLALARAALAEKGLPYRVETVHANFSDVAEVLRSLGIGQVDVLFADLGVSSPQLEDASRGLSFRREGPLDMRLDPRLSTTALELVNGLREQELGDLLFF